jgi:glycosidase
MEFTREIIYQIFVRNYSKEGTLKAVTASLDSIISEGADILYLMPIQPIGLVGRKGKMGSPYAIMDYRVISPDIGSMEELKELCSEVHKRGKKIILDMVFNHTSRDSILLKEHPEYFYHDKTGKTGNKIGDWADVCDLDHSNQDLEEYLVDTLVLYKNIGLDGFRFDVASLIPTSFFKKARKALGEESILFAECVDTEFVNSARAMGLNAHSNEELVESGFNSLYPYSYFQPLCEFLKTKNPVKLEVFKFAFLLANASIRKDAYISMAIENHDRDRLASYDQNEDFTRSLLAMTFFAKGPAFIYAGEEYKATHLPNLFEKDVISKDITDESYHEFYLKLTQLKHRVKNDLIFETQILQSPESTVLMKNSFENQNEEYGLFNFADKEMTFTLPDGNYQDLFTGEELTIHEEITTAKPMWLLKL